MSMPRPRRRLDTIHLRRGTLLLGFAALIAKLFIAGEMVKYMAPALDPLTALTAIVMAVMGVVELMGGWHRAHDHGHQVDAIEQTLTCVLVLLPIGLGILVTPRALGVGALGGENVERLLVAYAPGPAPSPGATPPAPSQPITDTAGLLAYLEQSGVSGVGQRVRVAGLALRGQSQGEREFTLLRYFIAHCVADARPLALLVFASANPPVAADQWVEVEGVLGVSEREGSRLVTIVADRARPIPEPPNPYLSSSF
jgi:putative membrane protein